jgi:hypothetical protein
MAIYGVAAPRPVLTYDPVRSGPDARGAWYLAHS